MVEISNNWIISLNQGDEFKTPLFINQGNKMYPIRYSLLKDKTASAYFSIMLPGQEFQNGLIRKRYDVISLQNQKEQKKDIVLTLTPQETASLLPGKYFYSVKILYNKNNQQKLATIIPDRMLFVKNKEEKGKN